MVAGTLSRGALAIGGGRGEYGYDPSTQQAPP
jgi:hypothetical protein